MYLDHDQNLLPPVLRESKLPWNPDYDDQAPAIRDGDSWTAYVGHLKFSLDVYWDTMGRDDGPSSEPVDFQLRLYNTATGNDLGYWEFPRLDIAVHVAQALHQERFEAVTTSINKQLQDAHERAA